MSDNPYLPMPATVAEVIEENATIKTLRLTLDDPAQRDAFSFQPGQVGQLSAYGAGEATFVINSPPTRMEHLQFSIMRAGEVTHALHGLRPGDSVGLRAPLGNWFPHQDMRGKDLVFVAGGIGIAPLRTLICYMLDKREDFGAIRIVYGARSPEDFCYKKDLADWTARADVELIRTVDAECADWSGCVGLVPQVLKDLDPSPDNAVAVTCGPPIMIRFTLQALGELGFAPEQVVTTLEKRMKCGIGICGRCNIGPVYVCTEGPVFTQAQLGALPNEL